MRSKRKPCVTVVSIGNFFTEKEYKYSALYLVSKESALIYFTL